MTTPQSSSRTKYMSRTAYHVMTLRCFPLEEANPAVSSKRDGPLSRSVRMRPVVTHREGKAPGYDMRVWVQGSHNPPLRRRLPPRPIVLCADGDSAVYTPDASPTATSPVLRANAPASFPIAQKIPPTNHVPTPVRLTQHHVREFDTGSSTQGKRQPRTADYFASEDLEVTLEKSGKDAPLSHPQPSCPGGCWVIPSSDNIPSVTSPRLPRQIQRPVHHLKHRAWKTLLSTGPLLRVLKTESVQAGEQQRADPARRAAAELSQDGASIFASGVSSRRQILCSTLPRAS